MILIILSIIGLVVMAGLAILFNVLDDGELEGWFGVSVATGVFAVIFLIMSIVLVGMYVEAHYKSLIVNEYFGTNYTTEQLMFASENIYYILKKEHDTRTESDVNLNIKGLKGLLK